jgi:plasmid stability protein
MSSPSREFFTVDLRGLRAGLRARAASHGLTESAECRNVLAAALGADRSDLFASSAGEVDPLNAAKVKLSVRLLKTASSRLDHNARAAGLSRGVYLARLVDGAPPVMASTDRAAMFNALNVSSAELALLSRDINQLTQLLRQGSVEAAREYTARHEALDGVVRAHLALAARVLAELSALCLAAKQSLVGQRAPKQP